MLVTTEDVEIISNLQSEVILLGETIIMGKSIWLQPQHAGSSREIVHGKYLA